jgi:hypothetical protein
MADHLDAPGLHPPGGDARTDITDIYAFQKPGDAAKSILVMNVNPLAPSLANEFRPQAVYRINVDTDADAVAEIAFSVVFSPVDDGNQTANVHRATGPKAAKPGTTGPVIIEEAPVSFGSTPIVTESGPYKFFAGLRSDPFFFDLLGFLNNFQFTGDDFFIDKNVFGIVLEVPNSALGPSPNIGVWARTTVRQKGTLAPVDRMGRPAINTVFNHGDEKNVFNRIEPTEDRADFLDSFVATLEALGGYSESEAIAIAEILLPDILTYDYSSSSGFLNGRKLADDVIDIELNLVTNGKILTDMVGAHTDYLSDFPYLGNPH